MCKGASVTSWHGGILPMARRDRSRITAGFYFGPGKDSSPIVLTTSTL